jgi:hypothetical protein
MGSVSSTGSAAMRMVVGAVGSDCAEHANNPKISAVANIREMKRCLFI